MRQDRNVACEELQAIAQREGPNFLCSLVTGDESWFHFYEPSGKRERMEWRHPGETPHASQRQASAGKRMASVFWDSRGILLVKWLPEGQPINSAYYCAVLGELLEAIKREVIGWGFSPTRYRKAPHQQRNSRHNSRSGLPPAAPFPILSRSRSEWLLAFWANEDTCTGSALRDPSAARYSSQQVAGRYLSWVVRSSPEPAPRTVGAMHSDARGLGGHLSGNWRISYDFHLIFFFYCKNFWSDPIRNLCI